MSAAQHRRGSRAIAKDIERDLVASGAMQRADSAAHKEQSEKLRARIAELETMLEKARRRIKLDECRAEVARRDLEEERAEHRKALSSSRFAVRTLCQILRSGRGLA